MKSFVGLYGLGVMGQSLALNMASKSYSVSVFNKFDYERLTVPFIEQKGKKFKIQGFPTLKEFVNSLERPRKVILMVTAGKAIDEILEEMIPLLDKGDIVADCGNSYFKDTMRREADCEKKGIYFFGVGVSGGEKGALTGPSIMPGGNKSVYDKYLKDLFDAMAAHTAKGEVCCDYIGENGSGHYVKMIHNGIEYGDIQIICEAYYFMKEALKLSNKEMAEVFRKWNQGRLNSYLIEITSKILLKKDEKTGKDLVDVILDKAGQKGTGKWTSIEALHLGVAAPTIAESVFARCLSAIKKERMEASLIYTKQVQQWQGSLKEALEDLENAVYASKILSYAQEFDILRQASREYHWNLSLGDIALLWREGCIIRAKFLERIKHAYSKNKSLKSLILSDEFKEDLNTAQRGWRNTVSTAIQSGVYMSTITNSLQYFDGYTSKRLMANLLQAQRDWFGAHTYQRIDGSENEIFHTDWEGMQEC